MKSEDFTYRKKKKKIRDVKFFEREKSFQSSNQRFVCQRKPTKLLFPFYSNSDRRKKDSSFGDFD